MEKDLKLTKIVATIGPSTDSAPMIKELITNGVNVIRFNTKHASPAWHEHHIKKVQKVADSLKKPIGIMLDLQGPEIRVNTRNQKDIKIREGETMKIHESFKSDKTKLAIPHPKVFEALHKGDHILIDDGYVDLLVTKKANGTLWAKSQKNAVIRDRKGANVPGKKISLPSLIEADLAQLDMASINKVDFIALSFVRDIKDVEVLRKEMEKRKIKAQVVVKIENSQALENLDSLIEISDAIMVARGDLGVEVPIEELALWQKKIIDKALSAHTPVITATEMLASMVTSPLPSRAEATDISNAVFAGTDALMLSAETASGKFPIEAVKTMAKIAYYNERQKPPFIFPRDARDKTQLIGMAAMEILIQDQVKVDKIVVFTQSGYTARVLSKFRPTVPIIAVTESQKTVETLTLSYAAYGYKFRFPKGKLVSPNYITDKLERKGVINKGESILVVHGARWKQPGLTNAITLVTQ